MLNFFRNKFDFLLFFLLNSFAGWLFGFLKIIFSRNKNPKFVVFWSFFSIVLVSLFNATKIPENDLEWYTSFYLLAGKYSLSEYMTFLTGGKEPLYQVIVYFIHVIGGDNIPFFIFSISLISYTFLLKALIIWKDELEIEEMDFVLCVMVLCFFPWTFALSAHIIRQFLALSIMLWTFFSFLKKRQLKFLCIAILDVFIHSSVVIFIPFLLLKKIEKPIKLKYIYVLLLVVFVFISSQSLVNVVMPYIVQNKTLYHIARKVSEGTTFETTLPLTQYLFSVFLVVLGFIAAYQLKPSLKQNKYISAFLNISLFLILFIAVNKNFTEIQLRYNFYFWSFIPFFVMIYLSSKHIHSFLKVFCMIALFIVWNLYNFFLSQWTYTCSCFYFLYPSFWYFLE